MATVNFNVATDMDAIDFGDWFEFSVTATDTGMVFEMGPETITFEGSDFDYLDFLGVSIPTDGILQTVTFTGPIEGVISDLNLDFSDLFGSLLDQDGLLDSLLNGADLVIGSGHADELLGFGGADRLKGGAGADLLDGGAGADKLFGGKGADIFAFADLDGVSKHKTDLIQDLSGKDFIDLSGLGVQALDQITSAYDAAKDLTRFAIDLDSDGKADFIIRAAGDHTDFSHFLLG